MHNARTETDTPRAWLRLHTDGRRGGGRRVQGAVVHGEAHAFSGYPRRTRLPGRAVGRQPVHRRCVHPGPLVLGADGRDSASFFSAVQFDRCYNVKNKCETE